MRILSIKHQVNEEHNIIIRLERITSDLINLSNHIFPSVET